MRYVKFIRSVDCELVPCAHYSESVRYDEYTPLECTDEILMTGPNKDGVKQRVAPIHHFCDMKRIRGLSSGEYETEANEVAVAYTKSVQELIQIPFDKIAEINKSLSEDNECLRGKNKSLSLRKEHLETRLSDYDSMSLWDRFKFLFLGNNLHTKR